MFLHFEGRIIDTYTRVTAPRSHFFVPLDNEVSARYLAWVITKARLANKQYENSGGVMGAKKFSVTSNTITETAKDYTREVTHITVYRRNEQGTMVVHRQFVKTDDGAICELEGVEPFAVDEHPLLEKWPMARRKQCASNNTKSHPNQVHSEERIQEGSYSIALESESEVESNKQC
eukprot:TRINITY_DN12027_c0_g4_i1.p1 TRINITY_DN12027_c0_g4~~TRINITY_DN12027_c0_g4_i1.p1  ORF type:complete len:176 (-),score=20.72 TRINITY_DN12027_c0_g4_i1:97-624(-)